PHRKKSSVKRIVLTAIWISTLGSFLCHKPLLAQTTKIHISAPSKSLSWFPAHLARERGLYRAEGLDVDFVIMKPQLALQALVSGDVGYTTALGSTMRAAIRGLSVRVVMTIAEKPLFSLIVRPGINSVEDLKGKILGITTFGASSDTLTRAVLRRYKLNPNQDVKILALGGGTNRIAALKTGAIDGALVEAPYNLILEREGFRKILFVGDLIPSPLAGFGTTLDKIRKQPEEIQRLVRATLRGIQHAKNNRQESVRSIMKWAEMDQALAEGSYEMAVSSWSNSGAASSQGIQIAMEEIRTEQKLDVLPDPSRAFEWSFVQR
ncbi:MAG TPA: ABC transporter substrate-binding protein, partial [Methylomirabilota bacterium]|nr:ABC transporter substrate-binding protein [Methylomirabilota bacterium]